MSFYLVTQIIGLNSVPIAGDEFESVDSLDIARERAEACAESLRNERMSTKAGDGKVTLASLVSAVSSGKQPSLDMHQLNIIMKVDVQVCINDLRPIVGITCMVLGERNYVGKSAFLLVLKLSN